MYRNRGLARLGKRGEARRKMEQHSQGAAVALDVQRAPGLADWMYDLRRGQLCIYGGLLRYIDTAIAQGKTKGEVKQITSWLDWYIDEQFGPTHTDAVKLVA